MLGKRFSGNGDFVGIAYNNDQVTEVTGYGNHPDGRRAEVKPGPSIISGIQYNRSRPFPDRFIFEDTSIPLAAVDISRRALPFVIGREMDSGFADALEEFRRIGEDLLDWNETGALNSSMVYLIMSVDDSKGEMLLDGDELEISWPGVPDQAIFTTLNKEIAEHTRTLGGRFIENFRWTFLGGSNLITVHPLGGCSLGDDSDEGVVDSRGQVFDAEGGLHDGLYVVDGAIVPSAIGVNPFLTISALAEHIADHLQDKLMP